jgi:hypothetical protein
MEPNEDGSWFFVLFEGRIEIESITLVLGIIFEIADRFSVERNRQEGN